MDLGVTCYIQLSEMKAEFKMERQCETEVNPVKNSVKQIKKLNMFLQGIKQAKCEIESETQRKNHQKIM